MIYHEVALEPTAIQDIKDFGLVQRTFGFEHGRLLALFPAKPKSGCWQEAFYNHLKEVIPASQHKRLELQIQTFFDHAVYRSRKNSELNASVNWKNAALAEHARKQFAAILCSEESIDENVLPFQELHAPGDEFPAFLRQPLHFAETLKDPDVFLENLAPLIMSAKRIQLIDPYLNPIHPDHNNRRRWQTSIRKLAEFLRDANRLTLDIELHTQADGAMDATEFVKQIGREICEYFPTTTNLFITAWSKKHLGLEWHARYLLTDKAGVALDYGLDMSTNRRTDVTLLSKSKAQERRDEFNRENPTVYHLEATTLLQGRRSCR